MPTPCGLGLKFTVGTAVSVSPLGLLGGSSGSAGATAQERRRRRRKKEEGKRTFYFNCYIRDISNKILNIASPLLKIHARATYYAVYSRSLGDLRTASARKLP